MWIFLKYIPLLGVFLCPVSLWASIYLWQVLPNTTDDVRLESVTLRNTGCSPISLDGYSVEDISGKKYIFDARVIESHTGYTLTRPISKIILNNMNETLFLRDASGMLIDTWHYATSEKWIPLTRSDVRDNSCTPMSVSGEVVSGEGSVSPEAVISGENGESGTPETSQNSQSWGTESSSFSWDLSASSLEYADRDRDGSIDTIIIEYDRTLTGSVNTGAILLYSNTGWLYENLINTLSGYIPSGSLSGTKIYLTLTDPPLKKPRLTINATTTSELRLKTQGDLGITSLSGQKLEELYLTTSFGKYKNIIHPSGQEWLPIVHTGSEVYSGTIRFPQIALAFQRYTDMTASGEILFCREVSCRLNVTLESIFSSDFPARDYQCQIFFSGTLLETCNPPQLTFSGSDIFTIILTHRSSWEYIRADFPIFLSSLEWPVQKNPWTLVDTNPPKLILEFDGAKRSYYEQINDHEFNCYAYTCSVNLTAEHSYDSEWPIHFLWIFWQGDIRTTRDPGVHKYGIWDHEITIRVFDMAGNLDEILYRIHVLWLKPKEEQLKKETLPRKEKVSLKQSTQKKKLKKMVFFNPPIIELQKSKFRLNGSTYICHTTSKTCSLNLSLTNVQKGIIYQWQYSDGESIVSKNPRARSFPPGTQKIRVSASYSGNANILWSEDIIVTVIQEKKPKKSKKSRSPKIKKTITDSIIPSAYASGSPETVEYGGITSLAFTLWIGLWAFSLWYRRRRLNTVLEQDAKQDTFL